MVIHLTSTVFNGRTAKLGHVSTFQKHHLLRNQTVDAALVLISCTSETWVGKGYCMPYMPSASLGFVHLYDLSRFFWIQTQFKPLSFGDLPCHLHTLEFCAETWATPLSGSNRFRFQILAVPIFKSNQRKVRNGSNMGGLKSYPRTIRFHPGFSLGFEAGDAEMRWCIIFFAGLAVPKFGRFQALSSRPTEMGKR